MKTFAIASVIALASVASAQLDNIPSCALNCFIGPLTSDGCSSLTDFKCHCQKGAQLLSTVQPCVAGGCSAADYAATTAAVEKTCQDAGAPIELPNASGAASSAVASASQAASSAIASASSSVAMVASSAAAAASSAAKSLASSAAASATGNASASAQPSASASQFTGGAPQATKAVGLLGAAAIAMLAL